MAVVPDNQSHRPEEVPHQVASSAFGGADLGQFGEGLRLHVPHEDDRLSFDAAHGHEDWHRSLRYPQ